MRLGIFVPEKQVILAQQSLNYHRAFASHRSEIDAKSLPQDQPRSAN